MKDTYVKKKGGLTINIQNLFKKKELVFSLEIFPPKLTTPIESVYKTLDGLKDVNPDFISVTYGAGGSINENRTVEISSLIKEQYNIESLAHLTCVNSTKDEVGQILQRLKEKGIQNILALRGDIPAGGNPKGDFKYASDLVKYIKEYNDFNIVGACYPEGHINNRDLGSDVENLKKKEDAGATHFISQLFFNNDDFYRFIDLSRSKGISVPIQAGIMPVINKKQVERIISLCGATFPRKFLKIVEKYEYHEEALRDAGIAYAVEQIVDLIASEVDGIHLYSMNNPYVAKKISESISSIRNTINV